MMNRRSFVFGAAAVVAAGSPIRVQRETKGLEKEIRTLEEVKKLSKEAAEKGFQYDSLRMVDEREDPSLTLETEELVAKVIDNTGLRPRPESLWMEQGYSHHFGYHGIRALWRKDEQRNIVSPFFSWLNLAGLRVDGLELDPVDSRATFGIGRGWPVRMEREAGSVVLKIPRMPVSGIEYSFRVKPSGADSLDFQISFTLHKKNRKTAAFNAIWPFYMSTYDEVQLHAPSGSADHPVWQAFGEKEPFVVGHSVNYVHRQRFFFPATPPVFPAVYGRIGSRVLAIMLSQPEPEMKFFLVNAGGHVAHSPVQNPAWDFSLNLPDYEPGKPFGFRGHLFYKSWEGADEIVDRYRQWKQELLS